MTVSTLHLLDKYTGDGITVAFPVTFQFFAVEDLLVTVDGLAQAFTMTGGDPRQALAYVTFSVAPALNSAIKIERVLPFTQPTALPVQGRFSPLAHESEFDRLLMQIQQLSAGLGAVTLTIQQLEVFQMVQTLTTITETEVLLVTTGPTALPATPMTGRLSMEIQNNGPNPIVVGSVSGTMLRTLQAKESWTVDYQGPMWGKATVVNQVSGAATVVTEGK